MTANKLVIVESPAKARTIGGYLGPEFTVEASVGHIRDLPQPSKLPADMKKGPFGKFAVDVTDGFKPYYVIDADKKKKVAELRRLLKEADELYLATDEDREGEAIAWHLLEALKPKIPVKRMVFHEITAEAIDQALQNTREVDLDLVDAQETRRILDRLVGYEVSPLLWRKVRAGLSAGRVQSVATRLVVDRERERMAHIAASYWDITGTYQRDTGDNAEASFKARVTSVDGRRVAVGRDFTDLAQLKEAAQKAQVLHLDESTAAGLAEGLRTAPTSVKEIETKPYKRRPAAPFTTSTLQQEASRKLRMNARDTMSVAQSLYENGYITYMRTDSTALSGQAIAAARSQAVALYGADSIPEKPRSYATKSKGAQEAHEAIRPAGSEFRTPKDLSGKLTAAQLKLYDLIWKRTVASQMADAQGSTATVRLEATVEVAGVARQVLASASGTVITFQGFLAAYEEGRDADRYAEGQADARLPILTAGDALTTQKVVAEAHETSAPPRYTEASLVKALEERGIGRPSTYAATISVIIDRGYVYRRGQALVPSFLAFSVTRLLEQNLERLVDYDFTASMEADLDLIANGEKDRSQWLANFYLGEKGLQTLVDSLGDIDARAVNSLQVSDGITLRVGRFGPYLEKADGTRASVPETIAPDEITPEKVAELFEAAADDGRELGIDPATGRTIVSRNGRFGPYVTEVIDEAEEAATKSKKKLKPRTASLFKTMDLGTIDLDTALRLLSLPREVGIDPESKEVITAQNGRFGPYLKKGTDSRSLEDESQLFTVTLEEALALYAQPKQRGRAAAKAPLREFGEDPVSQAKVVIKEGRFGPYITDGKTNVTVPRSETIEGLSEIRAFELLADKRAKGPAKKKPARRTAPKKTTTRTVKKAAPKRKTTTRKKPSED